MNVISLSGTYHGFRVIRRGKLIGVGWHYGFLTAKGLVLEISNGNPARLISLSDFTQGRQLEMEPELTPEEVPLASERMQQVLDAQAPYNLASNNCEQVARWVAYGEPRCMQFEAVAVLTFMALGLAALSAE